MFLFTTLAVLVAGAWALPAGDGMMMMKGNMTMMPDMPGTMATPMPCCTPPVWQGMIVDLNSPYEVISTVVFDSVKMLQGMWTTMRMSDEVVAHTLIDYGKKMMYTAEYPKGQAPTCKKEAFNMPIIKCLNDTVVTNLEYTGSSTLGLKGMGIYYDSWKFMAGDYAIQLGMAPVPGMMNVCYPVLERVKTKDSDMLLMFLEITTMIEYPTILSMPAPCVAAASAVIG